jgi:UDP-N-acetylmuramate--alanine ligase
MKNLMEDFASSLKIADSVMITDVYSAGESEIEGASSFALSEKMRCAGYKNVYYVPDKKDITSNLKTILKGGEMVIFLGAGDITKSCDEFLYNSKDKPGKVKVKSKNVKQDRQPSSQLANLILKQS